MTVLNAKTLQKLDTDTRNALINNTKTVSVTLLFSSFTAAALTETLSPAALLLPAGARVLGTDVVLTTPWSGGSVDSAFVDIGSAGDIDALVDNCNVFAAAVDGQASTRPIGVAPNKRFATATQLQVTLITTTGNVVAATAGSMTISVTYRVE